MMRKLNCVNKNSYKESQNIMQGNSIFINTDIFKLAIPILLFAFILYCIQDRLSLKVKYLLEDVLTGISILAFIYLIFT